MNCHLHLINKKRMKKHNCVANHHAACIKKKNKIEKNAVYKKARLKN